jgi:hypothetical protein
MGLKPSMRTAYSLLYLMRGPSQIAPVKTMTEITPVPENLTRETIAPTKTILPDNGELERLDGGS